MHNFLFCVFFSYSYPNSPKKIPGAPNTDPRIVGGELIDITKVPYHVGIQTIGRFHFCGGTIISDQWILSAAHCFTVGISNLEILVGATKHESEGKRIRIERIVKHPKYIAANADNDFVLVKLKEKLQLNDKVQPIRLPEASEKFESGRMCLVTGWGDIASWQSSPDDKLRGVLVPIVDQQKCNDAYGGGILASMICAGFYDEGGKDGKCKHFISHDIL